ncbi:50S ribosomal protein L13 [Candidatus Xiphinematobacter sp. Idaho Grape]|uniref:50S ribosomal protein L13 n=1 Tax=Candidatus Xiphinematobacter sp. Idaho Grape TaxID=1704307 RepID=UPI000706C949|nr:50S ribosomal protein L13 [Candidatus Xiphinematobacter sp. Idaho Grape]ALJ56459.1 50S ribosomal protein L13 [Candidatus Xiphinematobacter sp. Idaho Grape]
MSTYFAKTEEIKREWWVIDAGSQHLGRVAVKAASLLRGKHKVAFAPHVDTGDFVVVINAEKVQVSGRKETAKIYMSFSGYVGGHKSRSFRDYRKRRPEFLIEHAVRGMLPHNRLGRGVYRKLKVYRGNAHPHAAQNPRPV